jgi:hypothetical protein
MAIILKANKVNLFVSSVSFVFWYHSLNFLDTPRVCYTSGIRVKQQAFKEPTVTAVRVSNYTVEQTAI